MSALTDIITLLYSYQQDDIDKLAGKLNERRRATWINTLADLAQQHGCNQLPGTPKGEDAKWLRDRSLEDATSIANTYNKDLRREVERLYAANPRGNRQYYTSNLDAWAAKRDTWKVYQIALNTDGTARQYAMERFYSENRAAGTRFIATGPPAVCKICLKIFAAGIVTMRYVKAHPFPAHINCPHTYAALNPKRIDCEKLWLGG